ncbi:hypothetical protein C493_19116 [Natronolimnohabitans innermongolicus JCM 12255]|uniref:Uncharacterized protein n=1 Tax=Natronolimnohabitans innermongolicus JCM 12255 TaxID=1227499 RepID=L9WLT9_9EURY|nr:hypothetical protein C493_19116 [Natronolimnohabitans innermongolicus JCM 12255]
MIIEGYASKEVNAFADYSDAIPLKGEKIHDVVFRVVGVRNKDADDYIHLCVTNLHKKGSYRQI